MYCLKILNMLISVPRFRCIFYDGTYWGFWPYLAAISAGQTWPSSHWGVTSFHLRVCCSYPRHWQAGWLLLLAGEGITPCMVCANYSVFGAFPISLPFIVQPCGFVLRSWSNWCFNGVFPMIWRWITSLIQSGWMQTVVQVCVFETVIFVIEVIS